MGSPGSAAAAALVDAAAIPPFDLDGLRVDDERTGFREVSFNLMDGASSGRSLRSSAMSILRKPTFSCTHGRAV